MTKRWSVDVPGNAEAFLILLSDHSFVILKNPLVHHEIMGAMFVIRTWRQWDHRGMTYAWMQKYFYKFIHFIRKFSTLTQWLRYYAIHLSIHSTTTWLKVQTLYFDVLGLSLLQKIKKSFNDLLTEILQKSWETMISKCWMNSKKT